MLGFFTADPVKKIFRVNYRIKKKIEIDRFIIALRFQQLSKHKLNAKHGLSNTSGTATMANGVEFLRYNGKDREVHTGVRGGKHLIIDEKKRYLTKEHKENIFVSSKKKDSLAQQGEAALSSGVVKEVADLAEKLENVVLEPRKRELTSEPEEVEAEEAAEIASEEEASEEEASEDRG